jgi:hypothetical protein
MQIVADLAIDGHLLMSPFFSFMQVVEGNASSFLAPGLI